MRLVLAAVGRMKAGPERDLLDRYVTRSQALARVAGVGTMEAWDVDEGRARTAGERRRAEAEALEIRLGPGTFRVVLDERGTSLSSTGFASALARQRDAGVPAFALAVGGPDGFADGFKAGAALTFAFGAATLPHQLVRVLAAEQIYRALTILTGHPYHRG